MYYPASKTLELIENALVADQGAAYRQKLAEVLPHIGDAYRGESGPFRAHLGASTIENPCDRALYYNLHWATRRHSDGRMVRLFNRGHLEEGRIIALLLVAGLEVYQQDSNGNQFAISLHDGHYAGSGDGVAKGCPDVPPGETILLEFKTASRKNFDDMIVNGVAMSKPGYYVQMNQYMGEMHLNYALFIMVCKDTDRVHAEIVPFDAVNHEHYAARAGRVIAMVQAPDRKYANAGYFKCKYCNHNEACWEGKCDRNCRTCNQSYPAANKQWVCRKYNAPIPLKVQYNGCDHYVKRDNF